MRARRRTIVALVTTVAACAPAPPPVEPAPPPPPPPPVVTAAPSAAPPDPPPTASAVASSAPAPPPPPAPTYGPPPKPPMAMRWSFHMSPYAGHPATTMRLSIDEEGNGVYEREESDLIRCNARVAPDLHKKVVEAARGVVTSGCAKGPPKRETPQVSVEVTYAGKTSSCAANRDGSRYGAFQTQLDAVQEAICR